MPKSSAKSERDVVLTVFYVKTTNDDGNDFALNIAAANRGGAIERALTIWEADGVSVEGDQMISIWQQTESVYL